MAAIGVVVGNPKPRSRTLDVGCSVARAVAGIVGIDDDPLVVDLADLGPQLFDWSSPDVRAAAEDRGRGVLALIVASPTYKATYTGLLKSFLDWFDTTGLSGVTAVPVMVGAGAAHALAVEVHLRPVLVEIGATVPTRGLFVVESDLPRVDSVVAEWASDAAPLLRGSVRS